ncbi:Fic family protein [Pseudobacteroides cellulosolvens]|uniref:Filamentation induced by cAMP protein Fic n=1 Tax=Pseudobacteroides cellulosolvens ATCC 35603 = DSM 2933 TaxID=398512 RepID=A0A0L6JTF5_9FIRM|nr:Fic family protein [Pseudobacteroides cellulosolvens]KNY28994.1 filamentation induced by cAMP protein Fic [Pseudobacteroides cellulosolvens ATCC 35603 = DSM 2933]
MDFISAKQAAAKWGISDRQVRILCAAGKIKDAKRAGHSWLIPADSPKPEDGRVSRFRNSKLKELISRIDEKKVALDTLRPLTVGEVARLKDEFLVEFTYNSNAIEGNTLTLQETAMVLEGMTIDRKPLKDHLEVIGHRDAFEYMLQLIQEKVPLSERVIKEIHSLVLNDRPEDRGVYRRIPVRIMGAKHEPPQPYLVPVQMEQLMARHEEMVNTMHTVERVSLYHLLFEGVHPFIDGNGRTGRLLLNFELSSAGLPAINIKFADRRKYYDCFSSYYETGSHEQMALLVGGYVEEMLDRYLKILKG